MRLRAIVSVRRDYWRIDTRPDALVRDVMNVVLEETVDFVFPHRRGLCGRSWWRLITTMSLSVDLTINSG